MATVMHDGVAVRVAGLELVLPPMSAQTAKAHWARITAMQSGQMDLPDQLELTIDLVHACLLRNHPEVTLEMVEQHVDVGNYDELGAMCFGRGAWLRWVEVQAQLAGNVLPPPAPEADGRGVSSTPASPPPPAGGSETSIH